MSTNRLKFTDKQTWKLVLFSPYSIFNPFVKLVVFCYSKYNSVLGEEN